MNLMKDTMKDKEQSNSILEIDVEQIKDDLLTPIQKIGKAGKIWIAFLLLICLIGAYAYYLQLKNGLQVTDMHEFASWGIYISSFVYFVAISLVGALISSILKLLNLTSESL